MGMVEKIALVGFDDFDTADPLVPGVTVIAQHHSTGRKPWKCDPNKLSRRRRRIRQSNDEINFP
jgi:hypothetical protein